MKPQTILEALAKGEGDGTLTISMNRYKVNTGDADYDAAQLLLALQESNWTVGYTLKVLQAALWWAQYFTSIPRDDVKPILHKSKVNKPGKKRQRSFK